jgi:hypothetical protein
MTDKFHFMIEPTPPRWPTLYDQRTGYCRVVADLNRQVVDVAA